MDHQLTFLPDSLSEPLPPHSGSETSRAAAEAIRPRAGTLRYTVWIYLVSRGDEGATDEEMQRELGMNPSTQRPRRGELVAGGLARDSGRRCTVSSGNKATVWVAVEKP